MMGFFINYNDVIIQLPVNPNSLKISSSMNNKTVQMVGSGELNNLGYEKLKELTITSFLPARSGGYYINTNNDFKEPDYYINFIKEIKEKRTPVRLIITELEINMLVSIESFDYTYKYGTDDVDYGLKLKEYKEHNIKYLTLQGNDLVVINTINSFNNNSRTSSKTIPTNYTVQTNDSLWFIAQKLLGDGSRWIDIYTYNNNKEIIGSNPNLIYAGMVLSIPN